VVEAQRSAQLLDRLWGTDRSPSRLGRPAELDLRRILEMAVTLADAGGLTAVTLPKIAAALGVTGMSLYRYIGSKDELLVLMTDTGLGLPPELELTTVGWRDGLRGWALAEHNLYRRRPWLTRVPISGPPSGPNALAWMEAALVALRDTGLGPAAKVRILGLISGYVRQSSTLTQDLAAGRAPATSQAEQEQAYGNALANRVTPERFPEAAKLFASDVFNPADPPTEGSDFTLGLELILDGIAAQLPET
jgi:AcrR family transcriptional regulator